MVNRFDLLQDEKSAECGKTTDVNTSCSVVSFNKSVLNNKHKGIRIGTWNFQCLCNDRKALEINKLLSKNHIDIVGGKKAGK